MSTVSKENPERNMPSNVYCDIRYVEQSRVDGSSSSQPEKNIIQKTDT